ncbi:relaxation protein [Dyella nitratireducens]|uniref:Relaxation protein n=1 Tax=Dyella nitratireducens TaxID=1849580 RepID=A0ABQ1GV29_9GAMM|nr:relaxation protein [Dyella nitratireducens]GGA50637.1 hypothetical protein GCM10010981_45020 [Dyella nitratireducens]GLQ42617.1 hypothetical protein GCM10007902_24670 [Dyella nitratireducens]
MEATDLDELTSKTSMLMMRFEQRCQAVEQQLQVLAHDLQYLSRQLPEVVRHTADSALRTVPDKVKGGLQQAIDHHEQQLHAVGREVGQGVAQLGREMARLEGLHRMLVWKVVGVTAACLALLLVGGMWLLIHYTGVIHDKQLSAETLKMYNAADVVECDGRLCANVDAKGAHYGNHGEYVPIKPR